MAFGQQPGPPASPRQLEQLLLLLRNAGHAGFREARGPMGFNQRQAGGRFTRDEAAAFIEQLEDAGPPAPTDLRLQDVSTEELAAELQRRGWIVVEP
jgi:hypothetical protein